MNFYEDLINEIIIPDEFGYDYEYDDVEDVCQCIYDAYKRIESSYPNEDFSIEVGCTKLVIVDKNQDTVLKIPFNGYTDWDTWCPFHSAWNGEEYCDNYCRREVWLYDNALVEGYEEFFCGIELFGYTKDRTPVYEQKKLNFPVDMHTSIESIQSYDHYTDDFRCCGIFDCESGPCMLEAIGEDNFKRLMDFLIEYEVSDLHSANLAIDPQTGILCICDYGGFRE